MGRSWSLRHLFFVIGLVWVVLLLIPAVPAAVAPNPTTIALPPTEPPTQLPTISIPTLAPPATATTEVAPIVEPLVAAPEARTPLPTFSMPTADPNPPTTTLPPATALPATATLAPPTVTPLPTRTQPLQYGAVAHLFYQDRAQPLRLAREAGFGWIRQQIHWKDIEGPKGVYAWGELDQIVNEANQAGMKVLISVVRSPVFYSSTQFGMPQEERPLGQFMAALATHFRGRIHAIEVWNEQNLAHENGGWVVVEYAGHYVKLLKESYINIKAVAPEIQVIAGGPSSTGVTDPVIAVADIPYYEAMFSYNNGEIRRYMDGQAVHPGGSANPPDTLWPDKPSSAQGWTNHPTFYFRHIENVRALMVKHGLQDIPIWITEFGWVTRNETPGFEFGNQVSLEQQGDYIVGAMRLTEERYPWVAAMFVWNLNFAPLWAQQGRPNHEQAAFGIIDGSYQPRPAYYAIQRHLLTRR
jgi:GH35 family endo-1,4-beta-xylanase